MEKIIEFDNYISTFCKDISRRECELFDEKKCFEKYDFVINISSITKHNNLQRNTANELNFDFLEEIKKKINDFRQNADNKGIKYKYIKYCVIENNTNHTFIVALEKISDDELKKLMPYCKCKFCVAWFTQKIYICPCCQGCIRSDRPNHLEIKKARELYKKQTTLSKRFHNFCLFL